MDCSMPGFPVLHLECAQTHVPWVNDAIQSHSLSFPSWPQTLPASMYFLMSRHFASGGLMIGASASALPVNSQGWFPLGLTRLISSLSKGLSGVFSSTIIQKHQFFSAHSSLCSNSHLYVTTGKTIALTIRTFVSKVTIYSMKHFRCGKNWGKTSKWGKMLANKNCCWPGWP